MKKLFSAAAMSTKTHYSAGGVLNNFYLSSYYGLSESKEAAEAKALARHKHLHPNQDNYAVSVFEIPIETIRQALTEQEQSE